MGREIKILAWHNDPALKAEVMERLRQHRAEDSFIQGVYQRLAPELGSGYRGCAIGCTLPRHPVAECPCGCGGRDVQGPDVGWHTEVERLYGISIEIGHLIDDIFETLPPGQAGDFAVAVADAIPVGADLSRIVAFAKSYDDLLDVDRHGAAARLIADLAAAPVPAGAS